MECGVALHRQIVKQWTEGGFLNRSSRQIIKQWAEGGVGLHCFHQADCFNSGLRIFQYDT
jgi:hypothetical protein